GQLVIHTSAGMLSVYTSSHLGGTSFLYGLLESAASIGAIAAGFSATRFLGLARQHIATGSIFVAAAGLLLLAVSRHGAAAFLAILLIGAGTTWLRVLMQSVQQVATDPAYYGRMAAYRQMVNQSSVAIGGPILGLIAERFGAHMSYAALLIPVGITLLISIGFARDGRFLALIHSILPQQKNRQA
ncbi:MAG: MFS transporter, partial [Clostridia bacterium]